MEKNLICICCPRGCHLTVDENMSVSGNFCPRGAKYAIDELTHPTRIVTSTVKVNDGSYSVCSVKTASPVPKEKIFEVMEEINKVELKAPVSIGDIVIKNVLNLSVDIIATENIELVK